MLTVTQAALGRELQCTRAAVGKMVARGLPQREDGSLNRIEALTWVSRQRYAGQGRRAKRVIENATKLLGPERQPTDDPVEAMARGYEAALNDLRAPESLLAFAEDLVKLGASPAFAIIAAEALDQLLLDSGIADRPAWATQYAPIDWTEFHTKGGKKNGTH